MRGPKRFRTGSTTALRNQFFWAAAEHKAGDSSSKSKTSRDDTIGLIVSGAGMSGVDGSVGVLGAGDTGVYDGHDSVAEGVSDTGENDGDDSVVSEGASDTGENVGDGSVGEGSDTGKNVGDGSVEGGPLSIGEGSDTGENVGDGSLCRAGNARKTDRRTGRLAS